MKISKTWLYTILIAIAALVYWFFVRKKDDKSKTSSPIPPKNKIVGIVEKVQDFFTPEPKTEVPVPLTLIPKNTSDLYSKSYLQEANQVANEVTTEEFIPQTEKALNNDVA